MKLRRAGSESFFSGRMVQKWWNPVCTSKEYATSVSQLALAYGCGIFPTFEAARIGKKIRCPAADDLFRDSLNSMDVPWSNGFIEGCNNKTKVLKRVCFGMRNFSNFRKRILFCHT